MKTKVICAALLAMMVMGMKAEARTITAGKNTKKTVVVHRKAVNKKKVVKTSKPGKKAVKGSKKATTNAAKPVVKK